MSGLKKEGQCFVNSGGRVILAIGEGPTVEKAQANAYEHARQIKSDNLFIVMILGIKPSLSKIDCSI